MKSLDKSWKSQFDVVQHPLGHFLIVRKGHTWSHNMKFYKTKGGAEKGARAIFNKINKEFEKIVLN